MESSSTTAILQGAVGTTFLGSSQLINAGRDVVIHGHPTPAALFDLLRPVSNATLTPAGPVGKCVPGTRLSVIDAIKKWLNRRGKKAVCWLSGPAGYGKSAISQTIAQHYADKGRLLGSFFFLRGAGDQSHIARLIPTLAHQISVSVPATKPLLEQALQNERTMLDSSASLAYQFQRLIIEPLCSTSNTLSLFAKSKILIIDALDECDDKVQLAEFVDLLIDVSTRGQLPFRMLLTSRVEEHIRRKFNDPGAQSVLYCIDLGGFDARADIQLFFEQEFGRIYDQNLPVMREIPQPWPPHEALSVLLDKAGSSFMFAITLIRLVRDDPKPYKVLQEVLDSESNGLDLLYKQVLSSASGAEAFHQILGTIIVLQANQSITALSSLLHIQREEIVYELLGVQSIIKIPGDDNEPIMLYHTSLRDFLTIQSRSEKYFIDPPLRHLYLAMDCLKCLAEASTKAFFDNDAERYAHLEWLHHILLGFQEQEPIPNEAIVNSLVTLIGNLLLFQGKTWYNTILCGTLEDEKKMVEWLNAGKALLEALEGSMPAKRLFKRLQQVIDFHLKEKRSFIEWYLPGVLLFLHPLCDDDLDLHLNHHRLRHGLLGGYPKEHILDWRKATEPSTN